MLNYKIEGLGEVSLFVNKGAIGEWESHFDKNWIDLFIGNSTNPVSRMLSGGLLSEQWMVLVYKCYVVACYRDRKIPEYSLNDFKAFLDNETFSKMCNDVFPLFQKVVEWDKVMESLNKINSTVTPVKKKK